MQNGNQRGLKLPNQPILVGFLQSLFLGHFLVAHTSNNRPLTQAPLRESFSSLELVTSHDADDFISDSLVEK